MFSDKVNVNILTSLLLQSGVKHVVLCPGSRNVPLVHNFNATGTFRCYAVTDERSAGFFALGLSEALDAPVVVCVTSGSALLNVAPAVAEAMYQHRQLIVVSADRPVCMDGQLQGQTLPQAYALDSMVCRSLSLPEPHDATERWYCNRLVNEALVEMRRGDGGPVHINVPISEPLFGFSQPALPDERLVRWHGERTDDGTLSELAAAFAASERPMLLMGQMKPEELSGYQDEVAAIGRRAVVLCESLCGAEMQEPCHLDEQLVAITGQEEAYLPDMVVYMGDTFVSKRIKSFLRECSPARVVIVNRGGVLRDVFMNATDVLQASPSDVVCALSQAVHGLPSTPFRTLWQALQDTCSRHWRMYEPPYSQMAAVRELMRATDGLQCTFQLANSMSVRLGLTYATGYTYVNRGVNGIEGSLSTAVGFASAMCMPVFCVIGDLSFFYDQNALWNIHLTPRLRILLLNNGGGAIFQGLPGLTESPATARYITATHQTTAEGVCRQNGVSYLAAHNMDELKAGINCLIVGEEDRPLLLEVFTDAQEDTHAYSQYLQGIIKQ